MNEKFEQIMDNINLKSINNNNEKNCDKDEVDHVVGICKPCTKNNNITKASATTLTTTTILANNNNNTNCKNNNNNDISLNNNNNNNNNNQNKLATATLNSCMKRRIPGTLYGDCEVTTCVKAHLSTLEKLHLFHFPIRKKSDPTMEKSVSFKEKPKFVKSASLARMFGNTYNTKKTTNNNNTNNSSSSRTTTSTTTNNNNLNGGGGGGKGSLSGQIVTNKKSTVSNGKFHQTLDCEDQIDDVHYIKEFTDPPDISSKAIKTITRGLGKLLRRNCSSIDISTPDPEFKVSYLGNVLTGWAKGDGCVEKPLSTLWRNYTQNCKPEVVMKLRLCPSGLKATTRQHGLTEYWSHRITYCYAPKNYPKVFCWIYRHEGRKLKHELRCHAVICSKDTTAREICSILKENLATALREFKRDKICRQNARLSLANAVYDNPSMPRRKIMLSIGANNYRPPLERSKSAPKLMAIEEIVGEEEEEEEEDELNVRDVKNKNLMIDNYFTSTSLGRRRCRRSHSIRRSKHRNSFRKAKSVEPKSEAEEEAHDFDEVVTSPVAPVSKSFDSDLDDLAKLGLKSTNSGSDEDFESFLLINNYNSKEPLSGELLSYFDMKMNPIATSLQDLHEDGDDEVRGSRENMKLENVRNTMSLDDLNDFDTDSEHDVFFSQNDVLDILRRESNYKKETTLNAEEDGEEEEELEEDDEDEDKDKLESGSPSILTCSTLVSGSGGGIVGIDSDEGSISSGCETSSTVTTNTDELVNKPLSVLDRVRSFEQLAEHHVTAEPVGEKMRHHHPHHNNLKHHQHNFESTTLFKRSITFPAPGVRTKSYLMTPVAAINRELINHLESIDYDSEFSDESGYVEFQENSNSNSVVI